MYKKQNRDKQKDIRVVSLEDLVPRDHLLRKIDRAINFDFIYEEVKDLYSATEWGKPGIDPVSLFKIVLIQHLYGIRSMRQTIKETKSIWHIGGLLDMIFLKRYRIFQHSVKIIRDDFRGHRFLKESSRKSLRKQ